MRTKAEETDFNGFDTESEGEPLITNGEDVEGERSDSLVKRKG